MARGSQEESHDVRTHSRREFLGAGAGIAASAYGAYALSSPRLARAAMATVAARGKYAVIPPVVNPFYQPFPGAIKAAEAAFHTGPIAYQLPSSFTQDAENVIVNGLAAKGYNLMAIQPADPIAGNAEITRLVNSGIKVVAFGAAPAQPSKAVFALATDVKAAAFASATELIKLIGGRGNIVHFSGDVSDANTKPRIAGVKEAVAKTHGKVKLLQTITNDDSPSTAPPAVNDVFSAHGSQLNGIVCTAYNPAAAVANFLKKSHNHSIKVIGIDTAVDTIDAVKAGYLSGTMIQNPYGMCYLSIYSLKLLSEGYTWKKSSPFFVNSGTAFIDKANVAHWPRVQAELTKKLQKRWKSFFEPPKK